MLIQLLQLNNFRQYKGHQEIKFSNESNKNVTVIIGNNTSGKTTLIQSFLWCLYGKTNFKTKDILLNLDIANNLKDNETSKVEVEIHLEHKNILYKIIRTQIYIRIKQNILPENSIVEISFKHSSGEWKPISKRHDEVISKIIPEDLASYFFFDGERIENMIKNPKEGQKDISNAVKNILGLDAINNSIEHLKKVKKNFEKNIDEKGNLILQTLKKDKEISEKELTNIDLSINELDKNISFDDEKIKILEVELRNNEATKELQIKIDKNNSKIKKIQEIKLKLSKDIKKMFSEKSFMFFINHLTEQTNKIINNNNKIIDYNIPNITSETIKYLLEKKTCICGNKIIKDSKEYLKLLELQKIIPPESIGILLKKYFDKTIEYKKYGTDYMNSIKNDYLVYRNYIEEIMELQSENDEICKKLKTTKDMACVEEEKEKLLLNKKNDLKKRDEYIGQQKILTEKISDFDKKIKEQAFTKINNKHNSLCIEYTEDLLAKFENHYKKKEEEIKKELEKNINEIFKKMYHGKRKVILKDNYDYSLSINNLDANLNSKADESKGLETIMSFAFISSITKLAKEKANELFQIENEEDITISNNSEPYPLVMDAPFSNVDEIHIGKISEILPVISEQVIMFIMEKDWKYAENYLNKKLNKKYNLNKINEIITNLQEIL